MTGPVMGFVREKIATPELRDFAISDDTEKFSVLIEVNAPEPSLMFEPKSSKSRMPRRAMAVAFDKEAEKKERLAVEKTRASLQALELKPRFLKAARVFVVQTTPAQLRNILKLPTVRSVALNREVEQQS